VAELNGDVAGLTALFDHGSSGEVKPEAVSEESATTVSGAP